MLRKLIEDYLISSEEERAARKAAEEKISECELEAAKILERAAARAKKKTDEAERIRGELRKLPAPTWMDGVIKPIAEALSERTGLRSKVYGPSGLCSQVTITLCEDPDIALFRQDRKILVLQPDFHEDGLTILYETGEKTDRYKEDSLGALNGMNNVTAPLPDSVDEILEVMQELPRLRKALGLEDEE